MLSLHAPPFEAIPPVTAIIEFRHPATRRRSCLDTVVAYPGVNLSRHLCIHLYLMLFAIAAANALFSSHSADLQDQHNHFSIVILKGVGDVRIVKVIVEVTEKLV